MAARRAGRHDMAAENEMRRLRDYLEDTDLEMDRLRRELAGNEAVVFAQEDLRGYGDPAQVRAKVDTRGARQPSKIGGDHVTEDSGSGRDDVDGRDLSGAPVRDSRAGSGDQTARGHVDPARDLQHDDVAGHFPTRTQLVSTRERSLGAQTVTTPAEAAAALAYLANGAQERFDALVVDNEGTPLAVVGSFKGTITETPVHAEIVLAEAIRIRGAAGIWFAHNHPSGDPLLSRADLQVTGHLASFFEDSGIEVHGTLALGDGEFMHVSADGDITRGQTPAAAQGPTVPVLEREFVERGKLAEKLASPQHGADVAARLANGEFGVVLVDVKLRPIGFMPMDPQHAAQLRSGGRLATLLRGLSMSGAPSAIVVAPHGTGAAARNLAAALNLKSIGVLDIAHTAAGITTAGSELLAQQTGFGAGGPRGLQVPEEFTQDDTKRPVAAPGRISQIQRELRVSFHRGQAPR